MKKYALCATVLTLSLAILLVGCNGWGNGPEEPTHQTEWEETTAEMPTAEEVTTETTGSEKETAPGTGEGGTTVEEAASGEIPEHTGDYSRPY